MSRDLTPRVPEMKFRDFMNPVALNSGGSTKLRKEKVVIRDTKTGKKYGSRTIIQKTTEQTLLTSLLSIVNESDEDDSATELQIIPDLDIRKLKLNIRKGAADKEQNWKDALELTDTAFRVLNIPVPPLNNKDMWKQYLSLVKYSVQQLAIARGRTAEWRTTPAVSQD